MWGKIKLIGTMALKEYWGHGWEASMGSKERTLSRLGDLRPGRPALSPGAAEKGYDVQRESKTLPQTLFHPRSPHPRSCYQTN